MARKKKAKELSQREKKKMRTQQIIAIIFAIFIILAFIIGTIAPNGL